MAQVASWNEEGHINGGIFAGTYTPPRPFMRVWLPEELKGRGVYTTMHMLGVTAFSQQSIPRALDKAGPVFVKSVQDAMIKLNTPRNSDATIAMKGFDDPLRESGQLIESVKYEVGTKTRGER